MRALITSGGGAKGAFTVGALSYMIKEKGIDTFDIISGTSTGALIASMIAIGKIDVLEEIYLTVDNDDILRRQNIAANIRNSKPFIFDTAPLEGLIRTHIDDTAFNTIMASPVKLFLTAISLQSGRITVFSTKDVPAGTNYDVRRIRSRDQLLDALLASSNQAAFLPPVTISQGGNAEQFVDGGNREVIPALAVVDQVPAPDEIYVLSNNPGQIERIDKLYTNLFGVLMRAISIFIQDIRENDLDGLERFKAGHPGTVIHYIEPNRDLDPDYPTGLRFEPGMMGLMMGEGKRQARRVLGPPASPRPLSPTTPTEPDGDVLADVQRDQAVQCSATTEDGTPCRNMTRNLNGRCHVHDV